MKVVIIDRLTLGDDLDISCAKELGEVICYDSTPQELVKERIKDCDILFVNKAKLDKSNLEDAKNLKLICEAATGYDNIDIKYCKERGIAVCNVPGYSVYSVSQVTVSMVLSLVNHLSIYNRYTKDGTYIKNNSANILTPVYNELYNKTWGIIGYGAIGKRVGEVAKALGCKLIVNKRTPCDEAECVDIDTLIERSDIITVHTPLSEETRNLINKERIKKMKKTAILVNTARGAVIDEAAICDAVKNNEILGFGTDVYSKEPFDEESPYMKIKDLDNVCLTPHMAWGAKEARERCFDIMIKNAKSYLSGDNKNRIC